MTALTIYGFFRHRLTQVRALSKPLFTVALVAVCSFVISGQSNRGIQIPTLADGNGRGDQRLSSLEEEMRAKREIEATKKGHRENLNRARNLVSLSESLVRGFKEKNHLDRDAIKKLEKAEKLVKSIRGAAGGSDLDVDLEERPADLAAALSKLSELAESLKDRVEKTPKRVVSAAIIDEANVLLELIRVVRSMQAKA
jgi:hypothetical protein